MCKSSLLSKLNFILLIFCAVSFFGIVKPNSIIGQLDISTQNNIHIPMLFAFYAYLDAEYEIFPDKTNTDKVMSAIRKVFAGKISFYDNGKEAFSID